VTATLSVAAVHFTPTVVSPAVAVRLPGALGGLVSAEDWGEAMAVFDAAETLPAASTAFTV
jgi:hypothetical protein